MKKTSTILKVIFVALAIFLTICVSAQIANLDVSKYYMIVNHSLGGDAARGGNGKNAIAIDDNHYFEEGAMLEQQVRNEFMPRQLWRIVPITDSTYYFINYGTGMALGLSDWRGLNPFWTGGAYPSTNDEKIALQAVPGFVWNGSQRTVVQREFNPGDETQIWQPTEFPTNSTSGDTVFYRMTMAMHLADSGFSFNVWERWTFDGFKNICIFPGVLESSLYTDATSLYAYWFYKTLLDLSSTGDHLMENIHVYASNGSVIAKGELYGKNVEIYSILGTRIFSTLANSSELTIPIKNGLYIVKAGKMITKLVVE